MQWTQNKQLYLSFEALNKKRNKFPMIQFRLRCTEDVKKKLWHATNIFGSCMRESSMNIHTSADSSLQWTHVFICTIAIGYPKNTDGKAHFIHMLFNLFETYFAFFHNFRIQLRTQCAFHLPSEQEHNNSILNFQTYFDFGRHKHFYNPWDFCIRIFHIVFSSFIVSGKKKREI